MPFFLFEVERICQDVEHTSFLYAEEGLFKNSFYDFFSFISLKTGIYFSQLLKKLETLPQFYISLKTKLGK